MSLKITVPSPPIVPNGLTDLPKSYMLKATFAVFSIIFFLLLYVLLIVSLGYGIVWAFTYDMIDINKLTILLKIGAIAGSVMLFAFSLKFIFKLKNHKPENRIKLNEKDFPALFSFVYQICEETGAQKPKSIYVDPDVNAYVSYTNVWLSLFLPTRKELTIGLGLVSTLTLSEFKAVTAHEFGHFAQKSMKIGSYIHSANTIIHDMIFNRDKWDDLLVQWRGSDIRLSAAAWVITPLIWLIRKLLELFYMLLNYMHSALSREMEFNADKVAVKTSGSVAIVSALWKLDFGSSYWNTIVNNAYHATKKNVFTKNLYTHNLNFIDKDKENLLHKLEKLPVESNGAKKFFSNASNSSVGMYASHPPNDHREKSAKVPFVVCDMDSRSAWLLFDNETKIQEEMTLLVYENYIGKKPSDFVEPQIFEQFIASESRNKDLVEEYSNTFENRFIAIPEFNIEDVPDFEGNFTETLDQLKKELTELMIPVKEIETKMLKVQQISSREIKEKSFEYKGVEYPKKKLQECYSLLFSDRDILLNGSFTNWDKSFVTVHLKVAKKLQLENQLLAIYEQHKKIIDVYQNLIAAKNKILNGINDIQSHNDVTQWMVNNLVEDIKRHIEEVNKKLDEFDAITFVPLSNIDSVHELKEAIFENGGKIKKENGPIFEDGGLNRIIAALDSGISHCNRIENKSIDVILDFYKNKLVIG